MKLDPYIRKVAKACGHPEALITDESWVSDFSEIGGVLAVFLQKVTKKLGLSRTIKVRETVVSVAKKLQKLDKKKSTKGK